MSTPCVSSGARVVSVSELVGELSSPTSDERLVALTFDDAFASVARYAAPDSRLARAGGDRLLRGGAHRRPERLGERPGRRVRRAARVDGRDRGARLGRVRDRLARFRASAAASKASGAALEQEIVGSRQALESLTGTEVRSYAYPYGALPASGGAERSSSARTPQPARRDSHSSAERPDVHALPRVDAHYLRRPELLRRAAEGSLGSYLVARRLGSRARRAFRKDYVTRVKTVILAGGLGTRLAEETDLTPKPMVEIGGTPILWHIMKIYARHGFDEFVVALGYRAEVVKDYFLELLLPAQRLHDRPRAGQGRRPRQRAARTGASTWSTPGVDTQTGGRVKRLAAPAARRDVHADLRRRRRRRRHRPRCSRSTARTASSRRSRRCGRRRASAGSSSTATGSPSSPRSRRSARAGSTAASSCSSRRCSTTSTATTRSGSASRSSGSPRTGSSSPTATTASGSRWTRCATSGCSRACGRAATAPWKVWE